jgi:hypothetical protein
MPYYTVLAGTAVPVPTDLSDYVTGFVTYVKNNLKAGLIPRYEGPNETWNDQYSSTWFFREWIWTRFTALQKTNAVNGPYSEGEAYGAAISMLAQLVAGVYGVSQANVKTQRQYQIMVGFGTGRYNTVRYGDHTAGDNLGWYPVSTGITLSASKNWVTHITDQGYFTPVIYDISAMSQETAIADYWHTYGAGDLPYSYGPPVSTWMDYYCNACNPPDWASGVVYSANASGTPPLPNCVYNATDTNGYVCTADHTSSGTNRPDLSGGAAFWAKSNYGSLETIKGNRDNNFGANATTYATYYALKYSLYEGGFNALLGFGPANNRAFRQACLFSTALTTVDAQQFTNFQNIGTETEFPSIYGLAGGTIWRCFDSLYQPGNAQWQAILSWG